MFDNLREYRSEFTIRFAKILQDNLSEWKDAQNVALKYLYSAKVIKVYLLLSLFVFIIGLLRTENIVCSCLYAMIIFVGTLYTNIFFANKQYQNKIKTTLFPKLLKVFGDKIYYVKTFYSNNVTEKNFFERAVCLCGFTRYDMRYSPPTAYVEEYIEELYGNTTISNLEIEGCQLFDKKIERRDDDDCIAGIYNGVNFIMNETDFGSIIYTRNGDEYFRRFKGLVISFKLNKTIKSRVLIYSKRFLKKVPSHFEKVEMEYNKFNAKYDIYTDSTCENGAGQIEARYSLNVAFMERLMKIQTSFRVKKMSCSIYGDRMLIFLETKNDIFEMNHLLSKIDDVKQYERLFDEFASVFSFIDVLNLSSKTKL